MQLLWANGHIKPTLKVGICGDDENLGCSTCFEVIFIDFFCDGHKIEEQFMRQQLSVISTLCRGTLLAVYQYRSSLNGSVAANWVLAAAARKKIYFCTDF